MQIEVTPEMLAEARRYWSAEERLDLRRWPEKYRSDPSGWLEQKPQQDALLDLYGSSARLSRLVRDAIREATPPTEREE